MLEQWPPHFLQLLDLGRQFLFLCLQVPFASQEFGLQVLPFQQLRHPYHCLNFLEVFHLLPQALQRHRHNFHHRIFFQLLLLRRLFDYLLQ